MVVILKLVKDTIRLLLTAFDKITHQRLLCNTASRHMMEANAGVNMMFHPRLLRVLSACKTCGPEACRKKSTCNYHNVATKWYNIVTFAFHTWIDF